MVNGTYVHNYKIQSQYLYVVGGGCVLIDHPPNSDIAVHHYTVSMTI